LENQSSDIIEVFVAGVGVDFDPNAEVYPKLVNNMPYIMQVGVDRNSCNLELKLTAQR